MMEIGPGLVVAGRYRLAAQLGRGGMGEVWRAEHVALRSEVAVKLIDPDYVTRPDAAARFLREAQAAAGLQSPHIVRVFDYGVEDGVAFMVMELLDGESLSARLARVGRLPFADAVRVITHVARAIGKAHAAGIVHRDLKPDNVILVESDDEEVAKVLDFGIAKLTGAAAEQSNSTRTVTGVMLGTPAYMSPEQTSDTNTVDHRSDLWSLGVIAFECVTGQRPFRGRGLGELLLQICVTPVPMPSSVVAVPPGFDAWFARAVERDCARRFQSAREMSEALHRIADAKGHDERTQPMRAATPVTSDRTRASTVATVFPSLHSTGGIPNNLPAEGTEFVGRRSELRRIRAMLADSRLVTLVGPGGTGKTRLAQRSAAEMLGDFPDGVYFVPLAAISDARLVASAVAASLGVPESQDRPTLDALSEHLAPLRVLLVLDNFEQIAGAAADVGGLLDSAAGLRIIVTSRSPLALRREQVFDVPPLELPAGDEAADAATLASIDGVALFVCRAQAADPRFALTADNAAAVARVVTRLEGLPLAIELAAARVPLFAPDVLARRLEHGFELLRATASDLPARHRTLRDTVAWSYQLLDDAERTALRRLGAFAGSFSLESAGKVVTSPPIDDVVPLLTSLIAKSLVRRELSSARERLSTSSDSERLSMLEAIREFAEEELEKSGEARETRARHAAHFVTVAESAEAALRRPERAAVQRRLEADEANLRAALRFCLAAGDVECGLRIGGAIWRFWQSEGRLDEGRGWLSDFLDLPRAAQPARARGLVALAGLAYWQGQYDEALARYRAAHAIYTDLGDAFGVAETLFDMSTAASWGGDPTLGARMAEEALGRFEALGAREQVGMVLMAQGFAKWMQGDLAGARPLWESSIAIAREVGDDVEAAHKRLALASITFQEGHRARAVAEALDAMDELEQLSNVPLTVMALDWVAALAAEREPERCARLAGAAAQLRRTLGGGMRPEACGLTNARDVASRLLDQATVEQAWRDGSRMRLGEAVRYARGLRESVAAPG